MIAQVQVQVQVQAPVAWAMIHAPDGYPFINALLMLRPVHLCRRPVEGTDLSDMGIRAAFTSTKFSMLMRTENIGMDVAAHNITLEFMSWRQQLAHYK
jgi:hypothetical protein